MSVYEQMDKAIADRDAGAFADLLSDDFEFVRHQTGTTINKEEMANMTEAMLAEGGIDMKERRCIYENDDIVVMHSINDYSDNTREAVLIACTLKNGKVTRFESGATPLPR